MGGLEGPPKPPGARRRPGVAVTPLDFLWRATGTGDRARSPSRAASGARPGGRCDAGPRAHVWNRARSRGVLVRVVTRRERRPGRVHRAVVGSLAADREDRAGVGVAGRKTQVAD